MRPHQARHYLRGTRTFVGLREVDDIATNLRNWLYRPDEAMCSCGRTAERDRPPLAFFTQIDGWFCEQMAVSVFPRPEVRCLASNSVGVYVNLSTVGEPAHTRLVGRFGIMRASTVVFLDRPGGELERLRLSGIANVEHLVEMMTAALRRDSG